MDTISRKKAQEAKEAGAKAKSKRKEKHASDDYNPKIRPRETHPDSVKSEERISGNLNKLNRRLVTRPTALEKREEEKAVASEDRGVRVVTKSAAAKAPIPISLILSCVLLAVVFMYMLSLSVQIEEYSSSIDSLQNRIAELKEESTQLEVQLENKYDLDEVERVATQEYGMVVASSLQKKYISVSPEADVWEETEKEEKTSVIDRFFSSFKALFTGEKE